MEREAQCKDDDGDDDNNDDDDVVDDDDDDAYVGGYDDRNGFTEWIASS